jgi:hypothetical protein
MGRHKKEVRLNKVISFKVTEEQFNFIKSFSKEDKDIFNSKLKQFTEKYIGLLLSQNKISVDQNNDDKILVDQNKISVDQNNDDKILVDQNNSSKPELTDEEINDLIEDVKIPVHKAIKHRKQKSKELSDFEIDQLLIEQQTQAKYNGVNSLFEGGSNQ